MPSKFTAKDMDGMTMQEVAQKLGEAWQNNDMATFCGFFAEDGVIRHPLFNHAPLPPQAVVGVLSPQHKGTTKLANIVETKAFKAGAGSADVFYDEGGSISIGDEHRAMEGQMKVSIKLKGSRIEELYVSGYSVK